MGKGDRVREGREGKVGMRGGRDGKGGRSIIMSTGCCRVADLPDWYELDAL